MARISVPPVNVRIGIDGFKEHDLLGRAATGKRLSDLVERIEEPLVIALDGRWGSGKSFLLRCWTGAHTKENQGTAKVIYVDAFETDYLTDPLIALVAAIDRHLEPATEAQQRGLAQVKGAVERLWRPIAKPIARITVGSIAAGAAALAGSPDAAGAAAVAGAAAADAITAAGEEATAAIDVWGEAKGQREAMDHFRDGLKQLTAPAEEGGLARKLVLVIDELDRCRPDYALSLLEIAKHFFAVDNVHFVLGANMAELRNSVRARYGSGIDAQRYLQKFVSFTLELPQTSRGDERFSTASEYLKKVAPSVQLDPGIAQILYHYFSLPGMRLRTTPRDVQRVLRQLTLVPGGSSRISNMVDGYKVVVVGLGIMRAVEPDLFEKARTQRLTIEEVVEQFLTGVVPQTAEKFGSVVNDSWRAFLKVGLETVPNSWLELFEPELPKHVSDLANLVRQYFDDIEVPDTPAR